MSDKKTGILLLSHGSRLDDGEEVIKAYKEMYAEEFPDMPVEYGFMEIRKPGIPETINKLTSENDLDKIIVVPVFVAHGLHTKRDIPGILGIESDFDAESMYPVIITTIMTTVTTMVTVTDIIITTIMTMMMKQSNSMVKSY